MIGIGETIFRVGMHFNQDAVRARLLTTEALKVWLQLRAEGGFAPDDLYGLEVLITRGLVSPEMRQSRWTFMMPPSWPSAAA